MEAADRYRRRLRSAPCDRMSVRRAAPNVRAAARGASGRRFQRGHSGTSFGVEGQLSRAERRLGYTDRIDSGQTDHADAPGT
jgi:hypothetical protein